MRWSHSSNNTWAGSGRLQLPDQSRVNRTQAAHGIRQWFERIRRGVEAERNEVAVFIAHQQELTVCRQIEGAHYSSQLARHSRGVECAIIRNVEVIDASRISIDGKYVTAVG